MKVLTVAHAFPPDGVGGTERYAEATARGLQGRGHQVAVFSGTIEWRPEVEVERVDQDGLGVARVHRSDLYFDHWDKVFNPHVSRFFDEELQRQRPDVVHVHHWIRLTSDLVRRAAARGIPAVVHLHDQFVTCPRVFRVRPPDRTCDEPMGHDPCLPCVPRWSFQKDGEIRGALDFYRAELGAELASAARRIAPSASHGAGIERLAALTAGSIEVLQHPWLTETAVAPAAPANSPTGRLRVLFFSHIHPVKGVHRVLAALRRLGSGSGVELDCFGAFSTPDYEQQLRREAEGLPVRFHGAYRPGEPGRCAADLVLIPTLARESYSFLLDEAGLLGLPILAARRGALEERATERVELYDPDDPDELPRLLEELRDDPARRARLARGAAPAGVALASHLVELERVLEAARRDGPPPAALPPVALEHVTFEWDRREAAFQDLLRSEGWEEAQRKLHEQVEELRRRGDAPAQG